MPTFTGRRRKQCPPSTLACCEFKHVHGNGQPLRFETAATKDVQEELLSKLVQEKLLGSTRQIQELVPEELPHRELPPGNTAALYLMFISWVRSTGTCSDEKIACRTTFYNVARRWSACLKFRHRSEHSMCVQCQTLKAAIRASTEWLLVVLIFWKHIVWTHTRSV